MPDVLFCIRCQQYKPTHDFIDMTKYLKPNAKSIRGKRGPYCRDCRLSYSKQYRDHMPKKTSSAHERHQLLLRQRLHTRKYQERRILQAIDIYGERCQMCGNDNPVLFQFHHINGKRVPRKDRQNMAVRAIITAGEQLPDIQMLCSNCHIIADLEDGTNTRGRLIRRALAEREPQTSL